MDTIIGVLSNPNGGNGTGDRIPENQGPQEDARIPKFSLWIATRRSVWHDSNFLKQIFGLTWRALYETIRRQHETV